MQNHTETIKPHKFSDPDFTANNKKRAQVPFIQLDTLWINTGTLCNLTCKNCYIESSPKNDRLSYISFLEVKSYIDEIIDNKWPTETIGFTGGEPFMNPDIIKSLEYCLKNGFQCLVLTNAMQPLKKKYDELLSLNHNYKKLLKIRVSLDHYSQSEHENERGPRAWKFALEGLNWLNQNNFQISIAGRSLTNETQHEIYKGYENLFHSLDLKIDVNNPDQLTVFPEMDESKDTPEITTECWGILNKKPSSIMCANSRMVVKHRGAKTTNVVACTLIPYDKQFTYKDNIKSSMKPIKLNHSHCSKFCVLGGGACSQ